MIQHAFNTLKIAFVLLFAIFFCGTNVCAQDKERLNVEFRISVYNQAAANETQRATFRTLRWGYFINYEAAQKAVEEIRSQGVDAARKHGVNMIASGGHFRFSGFVGMAIVVYYPYFPMGAKVYQITGKDTKIKDQLIINEKSSITVTGQKLDCLETDSVTAL